MGADDKDVKVAATPILTNGETIGNGNAINNAVVTQWVSLFLKLERYALNMRSNAIARAIAYINLTVYETVVPSMIGLTSNINLIRFKPTTK